MNDPHPKAPGRPEPIDWDDRLVDRALRELHGERPPDLAAAIVARHRGAPRLAAGRAPTRRTAAASATAAAALLVALLLGALWSSSRAPATPIAAAQIEIQVTRGQLAFAREPAPLRPPDPHVVLVRRGDRIAADAAVVSEAFVGPFGMVRTEPGTLLEIVDMDVRTKNGWVAAGSLTLAVVTGAASWHWITQRGTAEAGEVLRLQTPSADEFGERGELAQAEHARLQRENEQLRQRISDLENEVGRRPAPPVAPATAAADAAPEEPEAAATGGPTFADARYADALAAIDWKVMGEVAAKMGIPLVELMQKLEAGEELPMELAIAIGKLNMELVGQLPKILDSGLEGSGPNGVWTHPLIVGNQLASLLQSGGLGLDARQHAALDALVRHFTAENDGIHAAPSELDLDRLIAEVAMKDRMYDELAQQLTPEQLAAVYPEGAGRFDGTSLFRSGLVWQAFATQVDAGDPPSYTAATARRLGERLGLDDATAARVRAIIEQTAATAPAEVWSPASGAETNPNTQFLRAGRALQAARLQQAWMRRVLFEVPLSQAQRDQLRELQQVFVPVPR